MSLNARKIKKEFPFLKTGVAYLDNASTTQKPRQVIEAVNAYNSAAANVHRGIYELSEHVSTQYENTREKVRAFIGAARQEEIIFTSGTTDGINKLGRMLGGTFNAGDEIILSPLEHHANLIPWQQIAKEKSLKLKFLQLTDDEQVDLEELPTLLTKKTRLLALTHISNASGYTLPIKEIAAVAHAHNVLVAVDAAQSVPHQPTNVQDLGVDFLTFSGHKMCAPTGVGVLYGRFELLDALEPTVFGGSMIEEVTLESATWAALPARLEPGTPNISGVIGLGAAIDYLNELGIDAINQRVHQLYTYMRAALEKLDGVTTYGPRDNNVCHGIVSFTVDGIHAHDIASSLDQDGIAVRAGHHCAQPLMDVWGVPSTVRASLYFTNTENDIDRLVTGIQKAQSLFT